MPTDEEFLAGNVSVIEEFRAHRGVVAYLGFPILLPTTTGARTGRRRTTPLGFGIDGSRVFVVASKGGAPHDPAWFHNLRANPSITVDWVAKPMRRGPSWPKARSVTGCLRSSEATLPALLSSRRVPLD